MSGSYRDYQKEQLAAVRLSDDGMPLTYERFLEAVEEMHGIAYVSMPSGCEKEDCFRTSWRSGGASGGDCWGGEAYDIGSGDEERSLDLLTHVLESLDVRLKEANAVMALVETGTTSESGYYGNWTRYTWKAVPYAVVYDKLVEFGYAAPRPEAAPAP